METKGRRKAKLAAPKSKSAAALIKRINRNIQIKENDGTDNSSKEACQFVPVRRKPLGEYIKLEVPMTSPSSSTQGMRMSYAAAVETGSGVKVMITPRFNKTNTASKSGKGKANKITSDTKFRIFIEQPKPHIVRVDSKMSRADVEPGKTRLSNAKIKKPIPQKTNKSLPKTDPNDVDIKALKLQFKRMECNKGDSLSTSSEQTRRHVKDPPEFADSVSYLSFHHQRLQRIIKKQNTCTISLQSPEPMKVPQFEDNHFKYLEEAALSAQNRTMLRLWMNSDQLIC